jgi:hypothetical protein
MAQPRAEVENAADAEQVKRARRRIGRREERRLGAYRAVLGTVPGRLVLWDLLCSTGLFESSYSESALIYFNEGRRNVGLKLRADLELADVEACEVMEREARARKKRDADEIDAGYTPAAASGADDSQERTN